jgi:hypothetical protein
VPLYKTFNAPAPTTASTVAVTTGTAIKTLLQVATPATRQLQIVSWGISFDGSAAATPGIVELIQTDVAATVTAHVAAGVQPQDPNAPASLMTLGTAATGYTGSAEGSITATRSLDVQHIAPTNQYIYQWMPDERPIVPASKFLRVRVKFAVAINALCWVVWDE